MKTKIFILVHGSYHGAWCWNKLMPLITIRGHEAMAVDLPVSITGRNTVELEDYINLLVETISKQEEKVYLVGHSSSGHIISSVGERVPEKIECLVYLSAVLLASGKSGGDIPRNKDEIPYTPRLMKDDKYKWYLNENDDDKDKLINYFYNNCSVEDSEWAIVRLRKQPIKPLLTKVALTDKNYGSIRKVYIECLKDNVIFPSVQRRMYSNVKCNNIYSIDADHSPFLSNPEKLAEILDKL